MAKKRRETSRVVVNDNPRQKPSVEILRADKLVLSRPTQVHGASNIEIVSVMFPRIGVSKKVVVRMKLSLDRDEIWIEVGKDALLAAIQEGAVEGLRRALIRDEQDKLLAETEG